MFFLHLTNNKLGLFILNQASVQPQRKLNSRYFPLRMHFCCSTFVCIKRVLFTPGLLAFTNHSSLLLSAEHPFEKAWLLSYFTKIDKGESRGSLFPKEPPQRCESQVAIISLNMTNLYYPYRYKCTM